MTDSAQRALYTLRLITEFENKLETFWPDGDMKQNEPEIYAALGAVLSALHAYRIAVEAHND